MTVKNALTILWVLMFCVSSPAVFGSDAICPGHLATVERSEDGGVITAGSKEALRAAVLAGRSLRVGWEFDWNSDGQVDITHWADASFLSEFEGEIYTQVTTINRQQPRPGQKRIHLPAGRWTGLLGTNGLLVSALEGEEPRDHPVRSHWCDAAAFSACAVPAWRLMYHHDQHGARIAGSKEALFEAVRRGDPIRFAWGLSAREGTVSVEHSAEPVFLTITGGEELFAQLPEHLAQTSYWDPQAVKFDDPAVLWRGLMGTNGSFDAVWVNRATGEEVRRWPQRARIAWFANSLDPACENRSGVILAVPGGVIKEEP